MKLTALDGFLISGVALVGGLSYVASKHLVSGLEPLPAISARFLIAFLFVASVVVVLALKGVVEKPKLKEVGSSALLGVLFGVVGPDDQRRKQGTRILRHGKLKPEVRSPMRAMTVA